MKEDHDDLLETPVREAKQRERNARTKAQNKPKRERRIKPIQTDDAPQKTTDGATAGPVASDLPYRGPFQADGVQVKDKDGRIVCMVASQAPMDVRIATATKLCDTLNAIKGW